MSGYIANFTVYTMAMTGLICFAVFVYKKVTDGTFQKGNGKFLSVEESMSLSPRKTLHVVKAGDEKFLIASDIDRTTLIAKLGQKEYVLESEKSQDFKDLINKQEIKTEEILLNEEIPVFKKPVNQKQVIHLDSISPNRKRKYGEKRNIQQNNVSPMREMAKRINEL